MDGEIGLGMVGVGNWGANLLRNFAAQEDARVRWICDVDERMLARRQRTCPGASITKSLDDVLNDPQVNAVVIATPAPEHFSCAWAALEAGKHVFVEKPLTLRACEAERLANAADCRGLKLMVGHLLRHHPVVEYVRRLIDAGELGDIRYAYTQRVNLGIVRSNENAWWSLAPHDISVICYLFDAVPERVSVQGQCFLQPGVEDLAFGMLHFADGRVAHIHVSWLDPYKIRRLTLGGTQKMLAFDDMEAAEKVRLYDKGAHIRQETTSYAEAVQVRSGDVLIPKVDLSEPLQRECRRFIQAIREDGSVLSDGWAGVEVVRILEAGSESLRRAGAPVALEDVAIRRLPQEETPALVGANQE